jgi:predicted nucleotidyltransferase
MLDVTKLGKALSHLRAQYENYKSLPQRTDLTEIDREAVPVTSFSQGIEMPALDIKQQDLQCLLGLLNQYIPGVEVWAFGSRTNGTAKTYSDIDLAAMTTPENKVNVILLREAFEESNLPFRVDFWEWNKLPASFQHSIEARYVRLV